MTRRDTTNERPIEESVEAVRKILPALEELLKAVYSTAGMSSEDVAATFGDIMDDLWRLTHVTTAAVEGLSLKGMSGVEATNIIYDEGEALWSLRKADVERIRSKFGEAAVD